MSYKDTVKYKDQHKVEDVDLTSIKRTVVNLKPATDEQDSYKPEPTAVSEASYQPMTIVTTVQPDSSQYTQIPPSPPFQLHNIKVVINMFGVLWPLVCTLMALYLHPLMLWVTKQWCHIWCLLIVHTLHKWPIHIVYLLHSPCYIPMVLHLFPTLFTSPQWPLLTLPKQLVKSQLNLWKQSLLGASKQ